MEVYAKYYMKVVKINKINVDAYDTLMLKLRKKNKKCILDVVYSPPKLSKENYKVLYHGI